ncbi:hypothetical protein EWM64_g3946 [Hericium alpestre]|uniref:CsbD-like domain-containing protein n=1 Tax=Hericium alpestre TaxID=135208 RepID=A0A4Z0A2G9_9AGAM|nr:hypothetical protein EWM64_g3946 [Hericium alpestre]
MPLFGKKHNDDNKHGQGAVVADSTRRDADVPRNGTGSTTRNGQQDYGLADRGATTGYDNNTSSMNRTGAGITGQSHAAGTHNLGTGRDAGGQQYPDQQYDGAGGQYGNNQSDLPPSQHLNQSTGHSPHPARRMEGKIEHAVGTLVGSQALQARGNEKEEEANAFKAQGRELAEAEKLEREAMLRRERAVAHGAHPENRHLGGPGHNVTLDS